MNTELHPSPSPAEQTEMDLSEGVDEASAVAMESEWDLATEEIEAPDADELQLNAYAYLMNRYSNEEARVKAQMDAALKRVRSKRKQLEWTRGREAQHLLEKRLEGRKERSYISPYGTLVLRAIGMKLDIQDKEAAISWLQLKGLSSLVTHKDTEGIDKAALTAWFTGDGAGVLPNGVTVVKEHDKFSVK